MRLTTGIIVLSLLALPTVRAGADVLYVTGYNTNTIYQISATGVVTSFLSTGLDGPMGITRDSNFNLVVANNQTHGTANKISTITVPGAVVGAYPGLASSSINRPQFIAYDTNGDLLASNFSSHLVCRITLTGTVTTVASYGTDVPTGVAIDSSRNVYVAHGGLSGVISKYASDGTYLGDVATGLVAPEGLVFDRFGNLYVSVEVSAANGQILKIAPGGSPTLFATAQTDFPTGMVFDQSGNMYVSNASNGPQLVTKITPDGTVSTFATNVPWSYSITAIPEPSACTLLAFAGTALLWRGGRRASRAKAMLGATTTLP